MPTRCKASFVIWNFDCDPDEVTKIMGVSPTDLWRKGHSRPRVSVRFPSNGWKLKSRLPDSAELGDQVLDLLQQIYPRGKELANLGAFEARVSVALYIAPEHRPLVYLDPEIVKKLGELHAAIDFDIYIEDDNGGCSRSRSEDND